MFRKLLFAALAFMREGDLHRHERAVRKPEDLDGLKIRVVGSPIFIETFRALGANPVNMNWGDAQTASLLQQMAVVFSEASTRFAQLAQQKRDLGQPPA